MKNIHSAVFGEIVAPDNFGEILSLITDEFSVVPDVYMWRGQSDINWPIHSGAYRRIVRKKASPADSDLSWYENDLLRRATHRGFRDDAGRHLPDLELLARLQHHGAATRLVDVTKNALVALYFATAEHAEKDGVLLGWHTDHLGGYEATTETEDYAKLFDFSKDRKLYAYTFEPTNVSPRVAAQHSQFLFSPVVDDPRGSLFTGNSIREFQAICISSKLKDECLANLARVFDIRHSTLFPDIDGFGTANAVMGSEWDRYRW